MQDVENRETEASKSAKKTRFLGRISENKSAATSGIKLTRCGPGDLFQV